MLYSMKTLVIFIFIALFAQYTTAQKIKMSRMDSLAYDLAYTKYNVGKFKKQMMTGIAISSIGWMAAISAPYIIDAKTIKELETQKIVSFSCLGVSLLGMLISIDSFSWLENASIKPTQYGVSFTIDLDSYE